MLTRYLSSFWCEQQGEKAIQKQIENQPTTIRKHRQLSYKHVQEDSAIETKFAQNKLPPTMPPPERLRCERHHNQVSSECPIPSISPVLSVRKVFTKETLHIPTSKNVPNPYNMQTCESCAEPKYLISYQKIHLKIYTSQTNDPKG